MFRQPWEQVGQVERGINAPPFGQRQHPRREVQPLQALDQRRQRQPRQPGAAAEVEAAPGGAATAGLPQRRREQLRRPVVQGAGEFGVEPLGEAVEQVADVLRRRLVGHRGAAEGGEQETGLRRQPRAGLGSIQGGPGGRDRALRIAVFAAGMGQGEARFGRLGRERGGPRERLQRRPRVAQRGERLAEVPQRRGIVGPAPQRRTQEAHRPLEVAGLGQGAAMVGEEHRRVGLEGQGAPGVPQRRPWLSALARDHAQEVLGIGVPRRRRHRLPVQRLGARQVARLVAGEAGLQQRSGVGPRHAGRVRPAPGRGNRWRAIHAPVIDLWKRFRLGSVSAEALIRVDGFPSEPSMPRSRAPSLQVVQKPRGGPRIRSRMQTSTHIGQRTDAVRGLDPNREFDLWLQRELGRLHGDVLHEPVPEGLLRILEGTPAPHD